MFLLPRDATVVLLKKEKACGLCVSVHVKMLNVDVSKDEWLLNFEFLCISSVFS